MKLRLSLSSLILLRDEDGRQLPFPSFGSEILKHYFSRFKMTESPQVQSDKVFLSFAEFYPFYLGEHENRISRRLHFSGTLLVITLALTAAFLKLPLLLVLLPICGYGFAWVGHYIFEKNRPATFKHPFYSVWGDFVMFKDMLIGRVPF